MVVFLVLAGLIQESAFGEEKGSCADLGWAGSDTWGLAGAVAGLVWSQLGFRVLTLLYLLLHVPHHPAGWRGLVHLL